MKINPDTIFEVLKELKVSADAANKAIAKMERMERLEKESKPKEPKPKKQFIVMLFTNADGTVPKEPVASVVQMVEDANPHTLIDMIGNAAEEYHSTKKGKKHKVATIGEALEGVPSKSFKNYGVAVKTKTPVIVIQTNNSLPESKQ